MHSVERIEPGGEIPPPLASEWDDLARRSKAPPFLRPGWIAAWRRSFGAGPLEVLCVRREGSLTALLPMERRRGGLSAPANAHTPCFGAVFEREDDATKLMRIALERSPTRLAMQHLGEGAGGLRSLGAAAAEAGARLSSSVLGRSPYIDTRGELSAYEKTLDAKLLREARRRRRRLEEQGPVELQIADGRAELDELLEQGFRIEGAAWKASTGTAIASDETTRGFYRSVAAWAADAGTLRLAFLRANGRTLAFDLCLEQDGVHYLLKTGYDPGARRLAPGVLIRREMIARAFMEGLTSYEFLGKDEAWKLRWTTAARVRLAASAFTPSVRGSVSRLWWNRMRPLVRRALARG